jgi:hypothetical protein
MNDNNKKRAFELFIKTIRKAQLAALKMSKFDEFRKQKTLLIV